MSTQPIIEEMLQQLGLLDECWTALDTLDDGCAYILDNIDLYLVSDSESESKALNEFISIGLL